MNKSEDISSEIRMLAEQAEQRFIPEKSKQGYCKEYEKLSNWMASKNYKVVDETLMLAYMNKMSTIYKSSTLWCIHSKLQTMLRIKHGVIIASIHKLHAFMKGTNKGYDPKKSLMFTEEQLRKFFIEAPDVTFLFLKVVAICGIFGVCRRHEMCDLHMPDIKKEGSVLIINIRPCKTKKDRKFAVTDDSKGKCIRQFVGVNTFRRCPFLVAKYLNLPDAAKFTGHAFRRTSATIMANSGMSVDELKRQVGWKSSTVAAGYVEESIENKLNVSRRIVGAVNGSNNTTSTSLKLNVLENAKDQQSASLQITNNELLKASGVQILNNTNCTFHIHLSK